MLKSLLALTTAASLVAAPAVAATHAASALSVQTAAVDGNETVTGNPFTAPGAGIGIALFSVIVVLGILTATGTLFDDDDNGVSI